MLKLEIVTLEINTIRMKEWRKIISKFTKENKNVSWETTLLHVRVNLDQLKLNNLENINLPNIFHQMHSVAKRLSSAFFQLNIVNLKLSYNIEDVKYLKGDRFGFNSKMLHNCIFLITNYKKLQHLELVIPYIELIELFNMEKFVNNLVSIRSLKSLDLNNCFNQFTKEGLKIIDYLTVLLGKFAKYSSNYSQYSEITTIKLPLSLNEILEEHKASDKCSLLADNIIKAVKFTNLMRVTPLPNLGNLQIEVEGIICSKLKKEGIPKLYNTYDKNFKNIFKLQEDCNNIVAKLEEESRNTEQPALSEHQLTSNSHALLTQKAYKLLYSDIQQTIQKHNEENHIILSQMKEFLSNYQNLSSEDLYYLIKFIIEYIQDPRYILPCLRRLQVNDIGKSYIYKSLVEVIHMLGNFKSFKEQNPNDMNLTDFIPLNEIEINYLENASIISEKLFQLNMIKTLLKLENEFALCNDPETAQLLRYHVEKFINNTDDGDSNEFLKKLLIVDANTKLRLTFDALEHSMYQDQIFSPEKQARADIYSRQDAEKQSIMTSFYKAKELSQQRALQESKEESIRRGIETKELEERQNIFLSHHNKFKEIIIRLTP